MAPDNRADWTEDNWKRSHAAIEGRKNWHSRNFNWATFVFEMMISYYVLGFTPVDAVNQLIHDYFWDLLDDVTLHRMDAEIDHVVAPMLNWTGVLWVPILDAYAVFARFSRRVENGLATWDEYEGPVTFYNAEGRVRIGTPPPPVAAAAPPDPAAVTAPDQDDEDDTGKDGKANGPYGGRFGRMNPNGGKRRRTK